MRACAVFSSAVATEGFAELLSSLGSSGLTHLKRCKAAQSVSSMNNQHDWHTHADMRSEADASQAATH